MSVAGSDDPSNTIICKGITRGVVSLRKTSVNVTKCYIYTYTFGEIIKFPITAMS